MFYNLYYLLTCYLLHDESVNNLCNPVTFYLVHDDSINIISSREKIYVKKKKCAYAHLCCGVLFNDSQRKWKRKIFYPSNITDEKALHLDISYPKISSVVTVYVMQETLSIVLFILKNCSTRKKNVENKMLTRSLQCLKLWIKRRVARILKATS